MHGYLGLIETKPLFLGQGSIVYSVCMYPSALIAFFFTSLFNLTETVPDSVSVYLFLLDDMA
jgi:hypothetical protein